MDDSDGHPTTLTFLRYMSPGDTIIDTGYGVERPDTYLGLDPNNPDYVRYVDEFGKPGIIPVHEWEGRFKTGDLYVAIEPDLPPKFTEFLDPGDVVVDHTYGDERHYIYREVTDDGYVEYREKDTMNIRQNLAACWQIAFEKGDMKQLLTVEDIPSDPFP